MRWPPTSGRRRVFVDTSAYFALFDQTEIQYQVAHAVTARLGADRRRLYTTNFVVAETHALLLARRGRGLAAQALAEVDESAGTTFVRISSRDERRAQEIIRQYDDKDFSLTDATSFAVMEQLHITQAFTFDHHFTQFGFQTIQSDLRR